MRGKWAHQICYREEFCQEIVYSWIAPIIRDPTDTNSQTWFPSLQQRTIHSSLEASTFKMSWERQYQIIQGRQSKDIKVRLSIIRRRPPSNDSLKCRSNSSSKGAEWRSHSKCRETRRRQVQIWETYWRVNCREPMELGEQKIRKVIDDWQNW